MTEGGRRGPAPGDETVPPVEGMGSHPSGPTFAPWSALTPQPDRTLPPTARPSVPSYRPPRRRLPTALAILSVLMVAAVVAVSSVSAARNDARPAAGGVTGSRPTTTPRTDRIEFGTAFGDGVLVIAGHSWVGSASSVHGELLRVRVELTCLDGQLDVSPDNFQAFDAHGQLFEITEDDVPGPLGDGTVTAGETVRGTVTFDLPRGDVTLIMNDGSQSVTALKIPD